MTNERFIEISSQILEDYLKKYPVTDFMKKLMISTRINGFVNRYGESVINYIDEIIDEIHDSAKQRKYDFFDLLDFLADTESSKDEQIKNEPMQKEENQTQEPKKCECRKQTGIKHSTYVSDSDEKKTIKVLLPGVNKSNVCIAVNDDTLSVSLKDVVIEAPFVNPDFVTRFTIDDDWNIDEMKASLDCGILTIDIPKIKKTDTTKYIEIL